MAVVFGVTLWWDFRVPSFGGARYQAVFLANGQAYFGRFHDRFGSYAKLDDVYYIQQTGGGDSGQPITTRILRRGTELHAPLTPMLIPKSAIQFVEDLSDDSAVAKFMAQDGNQ